MVQVKLAILFNHCFRMERLHDIKKVPCNLQSDKRRKHVQDSPLTTRLIHLIYHSEQEQGKRGFGDGGKIPSGFAVAT